MPSTLSAFNVGNAKAYGGEASAEFSVTRWLSVYANYSYQYIRDIL